MYLIYLCMLLLLQYNQVVSKIGVENEFAIFMCYHCFFIEGIYLQIKITQFINSARSNTLNSADVNVTSIEKSRSNYVISNLSPNTDYQVEVGVVASSPCHDLIPTAWSDPVRGTCVTSPSSMLRIFDKAPLCVNDEIITYIVVISLSYKFL